MQDEEQGWSESLGIKDEAGKGKEVKQEFADCL